MMLLAISILISCFLMTMLRPTSCLATEADIILAPKDTDSKSQESSLIIIQGADIPNTAYIPLAEAIQNSSPLKLWVIVYMFNVKSLPSSIFVYLRRSAFPLIFTML